MDFAKGNLYISRQVHELYGLDWYFILNRILWVPDVARRKICREEFPSAWRHSIDNIRFS